MNQEVSDHVPVLVDQLFRRESVRLVASLTRAFGPANLQLAEDAVQEALVKALHLWPYRGVPKHPTAWLARVARNRGLDILRRRKTWDRKEEQLLQMDPQSVLPDDLLHTEGRELADDELTLLFLCCHPSLTLRDQVLLTLKIAGGLSTEEIARALLSNRRAIEQRLVRTKKRLRERQARFEMPNRFERTARLDAIHQVLYLIFTEGYASTTHHLWLRTDLCAEALRLADLLAQSEATETPEGHALAALFAFHAARFPARFTRDGAMVELEDQQRDLWDQNLIRAGLQHFEASAAGDRVSRYHVEAEVAAHWTLEETPDWTYILSLYDDLRRLAPSPVVEVHLAVAMARSGQQEEALALLETLAKDPKLTTYVWFHIARGEIAATANRTGSALEAFRIARELIGDNPLADRMDQRIRDLAEGTARHD